MTTDELIAGILEREGGYADHPNDKGGPTNHGITAASWGHYKRLGRSAYRNEVKAITRAEAIEFYRVQYVLGGPFQAITYEPLRVQLIDFAVLSGQSRAIRWLQRVLDVPATGLMNGETQAALDRDRPKLINAALVGARIHMFHKIVEADPSQAVFLKGWTNRAIQFMEMA